MDSLNYSEVGFLFEVNGEAVFRGTDTVYGSIENSIYSLDETGANYMFGFTITDIDETEFLTGITVTPYVITNSGKIVYGDTAEYSVDALKPAVLNVDLSDILTSGSAIALPEDKKFYIKEDEN